METRKNVNLNLTPIVIAGGVVALVVVAVVVVIIARWIKKRKSEAYFTDNQKAIRKTDLSYASSDYVNFANKLYNAMKGLGTDEDAVFSVFSAMMSESDIRQLIVAFGTKKNQTLSEWLYDDLSTKDIDKINSILAKNGVDYTF